LNSQGPRLSLQPKATCAVPLCEEPSPCRGLRPHHVWKDRVGTWETSFGPQDSGVRRGIDVFKALALGATAVAVGRPVLWGSTVGGGPGVKSVYAHLIGEMKSAMLLSGVAKVGDIRREHVVLAKA
jgi:hypothetical protein